MHFVTASVSAILNSRWPTLTDINGWTDGHRYDNTPSDDRGRRGGKKSIGDREEPYCLVTL